MRNISFFRLSLGVLLLVLSCGPAQAQPSSFSYQGKLADGGTPANGTYQLQFKLYDTAGINTGTQIGSTMTFDGGSGNPSAVQVTNGIFTVQLDFGAVAFPGANRFLEISVKRTAEASYTQLDPRQQVTSTPYAVKSLNATNADTATNSTQLDGVAANQYVVTTDSRMTDARNPLPNSTNYIQNNPASTQSGSFNISGDGEIRSSAAGDNPSLTLTNTSTHGRRYRIASFADASSGFFAIRHDTLGEDLLRIEDEGGLSGTQRVVLPVTDIAHSTNIRAFAFNFLNRSSSGISAEAFGELINFGANTGREGVFNASRPGFWLRADTRSGIGFQFFKKAASSGAESLLMRIDEAGNVGIGTNDPLARLDIQAGADNNGNNDPKALAFSYRTGGFRHFVRTRHNSNAFAGNAIDFFVNNSTTPDGSSSPGTGNQHVMTLDRGNVGIGTISPNAKLQVVGGDGAITTQGTGLILRATDGPNCFRLTVNNVGALNTIGVPCP